MYRNLEAEIRRQGLTKFKLASLLQMQPSTLSQKLNGKSDFTLKEAFKIKQVLKVETISLEILFEKVEIRG